MNTDGRIQLLLVTLYSLMNTAFSFITPGPGMQARPNVLSQYWKGFESKKIGSQEEQYPGLF